MGTLYLITYDLLSPGQNWNRLVLALRQAGAKELLISAWAIRSTASAADLRDWIMKIVDANDRVLVTELANWAGFNLINNPNQM